MVLFSSSNSTVRAENRLHPSATHVPSPIYKNKPTALPKPPEVENQLRHGYLSANSSFNDRSNNSPAGSSTPRPHVICRAGSAPPSSSAATVEANFYRQPNRKHQSNRYIAFLSRRFRAVAKHIGRLTLTSTHSGSSVNSGDAASASLHSVQLFPLSSDRDSKTAYFQSCKDAFGGCPLPLPLPQSPVHSLPLPLPHDLSLRLPKTRHSASASSLESSPNSNSTMPLGNHYDKSNLSSTEFLQGSPLSPFALGDLEDAFKEDLSLGVCMGKMISGTVHRAWIDKHSNDLNRRRRIEIDIFRLPEWLYQGDEEFKAELKRLAQIRNSHVCPFVGYFFEKHLSPNGEQSGRKKWLLAYEHLPNGSLDRHLYGRHEPPPLDWFTRMKIALDAAQGLMQLHDKFPDKPMFWDFQPLNIQLDRDFNAKLTGYNVLNKYSAPAAEISKQLLVSGYVAPETAEEGKLCVKSNVWSFGVVLLELLTGRPPWDKVFSYEEHDLETWCISCLTDTSKLFRVVDPELNGQYPAEDAKIVANLAQQCLRRDWTLRPDIWSLIGVLKSVQKVTFNPIHNSEYQAAAATSVGFPNRNGRSLRELLHDPDLRDDDSSKLECFWKKAVRFVKLPEQSRENIVGSFLKWIKTSGLPL